MKQPYETKEGIFDGVPILGGERLPAFYLVDYIEEDYTLGEFLEDYSLDPEHVEAFLLHPLPLSVRQSYEKNLI